MYSTFLEMIENIKNESKPTIKMRYLQDIPEFSKMLLSIYVFEWVDKVPVPKWNSMEVSDTDITIVIVDVIRNGMFDTKRYYKLPFKVQQVLYYISKGSDFGLNDKHIMSTCGVVSKMDVLRILNLTEVASKPKCPRCGIESEHLCEKCIELLKTSMDYRVTSFEVYGVSLEDFSTTILDWKIDVKNSKYTFTKIDSNETYQPKLPFEEYQNNLALLM